MADNIMFLVWQSNLSKNILSHLMQYIDNWTEAYFLGHLILSHYLDRSLL